MYNNNTPQNNNITKPTEYIAQYYIFLVELYHNIIVS